VNKKPTTRHQPLKKIPYIYHVETLITYYPFGLKHEYYNTQERKVKYKEQNTSKRAIKQALTDEVKFKYWYQEQERQTDLDLNWDSFKYRNYDYAIGRFMSIDPLAEKYPYNGVYNFSENRVIDGRELEGLEYTSTDAILHAKNSGYYTPQKSKSSNSNPNFKVGSGVLWSDMQKHIQIMVKKALTFGMLRWMLLI